MSCQFTITSAEPIEQLIAKARTAISAAGGTFEGNTEKGSYGLSTPLGKVAGTYTVNTANIEFRISDKPFLIPCSTIEQTLRKYLEPPASPAS